MTDSHLPYTLTRIVMIQARPATVFGYFQDSARWAAWWGAGSTIDSRPGGQVRICLPGGVEVAGEVVEIAPPDRLVFTYGFVSGTPIGVGESVVTIRLEPTSGGTRLSLTHAFAHGPVRDEHEQGWRFHLSLFGNLVANDLHRDAAALADAWFAAWAEPDGTTRRDALAAIASAHLQFGDRYSLLDGIDDVSMHAGAAQKFMPGMRLERTGQARQCLGTALVDWVVNGADGTPRATGTNVFQFDADGRIERVTGLWS